MSGYNNISPVIYTAPSSWIEQQTLRGIGSNRSRLYVDASGDLWGQFENNPPKKIAGLGGAGSSTSTEVPVGAVFQWIGNTAPDGYLMCDGSAIAGSYPKLAALLQGTYGGKTPDFRGRVIIGSVGQTGLPSDRQNFPGSLQLGATGGASSLELTIEQIPSHVHGIFEEEAGSHTHTFDIPTHTHALSGSVPGHSHTFDAGGYVSDALVEQDADSADWAPSVGDDTNPTWTNTDLVTGDENWTGTPVAVTGGGTTTGESGAIDYTTADGGYHDHLTTQDDSSINDADPDAYTGDGGIDVGNTNDNDDYGNMTMSWPTKPTFSTDSSSTTGAADYTATPVAVTGGAIDINTGDAGAIDYTTTDGGYHDHLTTQDDSAIADGDPDAYSGDGGIDIGNTADNDTYGNMTTSWVTKPSADISEDVTTGGASWSDTPIASSGGAGTTSGSGTLTTSSDTDATYDITTSTSGAHDHLEIDTIDDDDDVGLTSGGDGVGGDLGIDVGGPAGGGGHNAPLGIDWYGSGSWGADTIEIPANTSYDVTTDVQSGGTETGSAGSHSHTVDGSTTSAGGHNHTTVAAGGETVTSELAIDDSGDSVHSSLDQLGLITNWNWEIWAYNNIALDTGSVDATEDTYVNIVYEDGSSTSRFLWSPDDSTDFNDFDEAPNNWDGLSSVGLRDHKHSVATDNHTHSVDTEAGHTHDIDGDTSDHGGHSHDMNHTHPVTVGNHTHSCNVDLFYHTHEFDLPHVHHTGHDHDFDFNIPPHNHTVASHVHTTPNHTHNLEGIAHTHDIDGVDVTLDDNGWDHTHYIDIPFTRGTHSHDIDIAAHTHSIDVAGHAHALANLSHTHDFGGVTVNSSDTGWDHTHEFDIPFSRGTHSHDIDIEGHTHTIPTHAHSLSGLDHTHDVPTSNFDHGHAMDETESSHFHRVQYDLEASTSVENNGIGWVNSMSIGGSATAGGGVTGGETSSSSASAHNHGGYTESTGGREAIIGTEVDPVEVCPPYIAINFIIKHD